MKAIRLAAGLLVMLLSGCTAMGVETSPVLSVASEHPPPTIAAVSTPRVRETPPLPTPTALSESALPPDIQAVRQTFFDRGYGIQFLVDSVAGADEVGAEWNELTVAVTKGDKTILRIGPKKLLGGIISSESESLDPAWLDILFFQPPENTVAGAQAYYDGGGDYVLASYEPSDNSVAVWHRTFAGPDTADLSGDWEFVAGAMLEDDVEVTLEWKRSA